MDVGNILTYVLRFLILLPAIILHEVAHGYVAYRLGDPTAKVSGRLTLNPISHIDPWGTILLPAVMLIMSGGTMAFGYAKPVPVNPFLMRRTSPRTGMMLTGIAGPAANVALAVAFGLLVRVASYVPGIPDIVFMILYAFVYMNLVLAFFNLIPIPPLDGSRVIQRFLPDGALRAYEQVERFGFVILIGVLYLLPGLLSAYLSLTVVPVAWILTGVQP